MKKIFLLSAFCFVVKFSSAQFNTTLVMSPNPPGAILDWSVKDLTYIISGSAGIAGRAILKTTLKTSDGTIVASTDLGKARQITINPAAGNIVLYAADVIPLETTVFTGKFKTSLERTGKLPAGSYMLCVQLVAPVSYQILSEEKCRSFTIASFQLPIPMMPANETILDIEKAKAAITFRWTPVAPKPAELLTYRVTVFEVLDYQTPMQALRSNQPLLTKDIIGTTQFVWQPQLGMTICCMGDPDFDLKMKKDTIRTIRPDMEPDILIRADAEADAYAFIWTIQTFDSRGAPFGDGNVNSDGISEPNVFFIDRRPPAMRRSGPPERINFLKGKRN